MTAEERYQANLRHVAEKSPVLAQQLDGMPITNCALFPCADEPETLSGSVWDTVTQQYVPLGHPSAPLAEARQSVQSMYTPNARVFVMLGVGLGHFAAEFAAMLKPYQRLGIFELDPNLYKAAMYAVDMAPLFEKRVNVNVGPSLVAALQQWFLTFDSQEKLHIGQPMRSIYTNYAHKDVYDQACAMIEEMLRYHAVSLATWRQFGDHIGHNDFENIPELLLNPGLEALHNAWENKPAVCIAAGPSLRKNLRLLMDPAYRERVMVICAGPMYATLQALGIVPDVVTAIDFQRLTWTDQFQNIPLDPRVALVYLHSTWGRIVQRWPGPRFVAMNSSDAVNWIRSNLLGERRVYDASSVQTVAHLNVHVALAVGANPIMLMGQDLSMPWQMHHAPGARSQDLAPNETPAEALIPMQDYAGNPCWSRHSFLSMKLVFERLAAQYQDRTFLNCSEGGLALAGIPNVPLRDTLDSMPRLDEVPPESIQRMFLERYTLAKPAMNISDACQKLHDLRADIAEFARWATETQAVTPETQMDHGHVCEKYAFLVACLATVHFDLIERFAKIPCESEQEQSKEICDRIEHVATVAREHLPIFSRRVRHVLHRLRSTICQGDNSQAAIIALIRNGFYQEALQKAWACKEAAAIMQICYTAQQQEAAAQALERLSLRSVLSSKLRALQANMQAVRLAIAPYFQEDDSWQAMPAPNPPSPEPWNSIAILDA